jgi:hypothetical protein
MKLYTIFMKSRQGERAREGLRPWNGGMMEYRDRDRGPVQATKPEDRTLMAESWHPRHKDKKHLPT